jgi:prepilin-type N-terminal cleavage/methylation domain-containing protein
MAQDHAQQRVTAEHRNGFTLAELLVVLAICAVIWLVLDGYIRHAKDHARQALCLSNMKQLGAAVQLYAQDWDETLPPAIQTSASPAADLCPDHNGPVVLNTIYDEIFAYMKSAQIVQCPNAPQAIDICNDLGAMAPEAAGEPQLAKGNVGPAGNFRYVSYGLNRTLFGIGGFRVAGADITGAVHRRLGNRIGFPYALDQIPYPADTPTLFDGAIAGHEQKIIAYGRVEDAAIVGYVDGHAEAFRMTSLNRSEDSHDGSGRWIVNRRYGVDSGPYRSDPGAPPNLSFDGIAKDPVCAATTVPSRDCVSRSAPAPKQSHVSGSPVEGKR